MSEMISLVAFVSLRLWTSSHFYMLSWGSYRPVQNCSIGHFKTLPTLGSSFTIHVGPPSPWPVPVTHMRIFWHCSLPLISTQMGTAISTAPDPFYLSSVNHEPSILTMRRDGQKRKIIRKMCI